MPKRMRKRLVMAKLAHQLVVINLSEAACCYIRLVRIDMKTSLLIILSSHLSAQYFLLQSFGGHYGYKQIESVELA